MASAPSATAIPQSARCPPPLENIWHSPLVPAALAVTAGILLDGTFTVPIAVSLVAAVACLGAWAAATAGRAAGLPLVYLALAAVAFGAAWHHYRLDVHSPDDIGDLTPTEPRPAQVRGVLAEEPTRRAAIRDDPLRSRDRPESATTVLAVSAIRQPEGWTAVSGRLRLMAGDALDELHAGDRVEAVGRLQRIRGPANPGEFDVASHWRDRGVRAELVVRAAPGAVVRVERGWPASLFGILAVIRGWGQDTLSRHLPPETSDLAAALLLGEGAALGSGEWDKYIRTGVVHVLVISGQHLIVLGAALWWLLRLLGVRQRHGAAIVGVALFGYALLTGGQPPVLRAAIMVGAVCIAIVLRRRTLPANTLALAWLVIVLLDPTDVSSTGCLLSFLCVALLHWGTRQLAKHETDPLEQLIELSRPAWQRLLRRAGRAILLAYVATALLWLAITPLAAARYHLVAPVGILLGPPLIVLTSLALIGGFLLLAAAAIAPPLAAVFAPFVNLPLRACDWFVNLGDSIPGGHFYVGDVPVWWLVFFYLGLVAVLTQEWLRAHWRWGLSAGAAWMGLGLLGAAARLPADELRCTFLAVGHGGCTVLETPDGRTLLYDAGAIAGPELARRQIAPFLWHRGIRRIDEVFLSHADLDHFNGLPDLLSRFSIGRVTCTPTFADKTSRAVVYTLAALERQGIATRIVKAGDVLSAGAVTLEVLHPPAAGPDGTENARSLVLLVRHAGHTLLLTGDLEGSGLDMLLSSAPRRVEVLMAPHHGSRRSNSAELAAWCRPRVVVSCQGPPIGWREAPEPYSAHGARFFGTWPHGAVTLRSHASGMVVETFVTGERMVVRSRHD